MAPVRSCGNRIQGGAAASCAGPGDERLPRGCSMLWVSLCWRVARLPSRTKPGTSLVLSSARNWHGCLHRLAAHWVFLLVQVPATVAPRSSESCAISAPNHFILLVRLLTSSPALFARRRKRPEYSRLLRALHELLRSRFALAKSRLLPEWSRARSNGGRRQRLT